MDNQLFNRACQLSMLILLWVGFVRDISEARNVVYFTIWAYSLIFIAGLVLYGNEWLEDVKPRKRKRNFVDNLYIVMVCSFFVWHEAIATAIIYGLPICLMAAIETKSSKKGIVYKSDGENE